MAGAPAPRSGGVTFLGSYTYQLDEKGRVSLPAAFRRAAPGQGFVLLQAYRPSLALYPESEWLGVQERLKELIRHQPDARMYVLSVLANAGEVVPDAQGRSLIPARLQEAAERTGPVRLGGARDKIELWSPELFGAALRSGGGRG